MTRLGQEVGPSVRFPYLVAARGVTRPWDRQEGRDQLGEYGRDVTRLGQTVGPSANLPYLVAVRGVTRPWGRREGRDQLGSDGRAFCKHALPRCGAPHDSSLGQTGGE